MIEISWIQINSIVFLTILASLSFAGKYDIPNTYFYIDVTLGKILSFIFTQVIFMICNQKWVKMTGPIVGTIFTIISCIGNYKSGEHVK